MIVNVDSKCCHSLDSACKDREHQLWGEGGGFILGITEVRVRLE